MTKYNARVRDIWASKATKGEVGIEVELEGENIPRNPLDPYWDYHRDPSLRGNENAEYVLYKPIPRDEVAKALKDLFGQLKKHGAKIRKDSPYTSVHVHINYQDWSLKQTYNAIVLWYILENTLMQFCGEERVGNLFCLRGQDAEAILQRLASAVRYGKYNILNDQDGLRYTALNATSLTKFGSLKYRGLAGIYDEEVINTWVDVLLAVKDYAAKFESPPDIIREFSTLGPVQFFRAVFPHHWQTLTTKNLVEELRNGMRQVQNVAYCIDWKRGDPEDAKKKIPTY
jgi:putative amidoligase enzyme